MSIDAAPEQASSQQHSVLESRHEPYFVQQVPVSSSLQGLSRLQVFSRLLAGKRVLHVGYADWPITDLSNNLHVALDGVCSQLDGVDPHDEAAQALRPHVRGELFTSIDQVRDAYDVVLVPEVLEHVGDAETFLRELSGVDFESIIITVPDAFQCRSGHFDYNSGTGVFVEVVHPDHNYWFTPYTLTNTIRKYTSWHIDGVFFFNNISLLLLASKNAPGDASQSQQASQLPAQALELPTVEEAITAARSAEFEERTALARVLPAPGSLVPREESSADDAFHVCYLMPRTDVGGGARVIIEHANQLTLAGARVTVLSHFPEPTWSPLSATFVQVPFGYELCDAIPPCDVVVAGYWEQVVAARNVGVAPVIHFEQGDSHLFEPQSDEREQLVATNLQYADATITLSAANADILSSRYGTTATVVQNALDPSVFHPAGDAAAALNSHAKPYLLVVGWDGNTFKGVDDVFAAWSRLRDEGRDVDIVWVTPRPPVLSRGRVVVAPSQGELARLYQGAAVYVHASHYESFPLPPLEAMACDTPVVATRNGGVLGYAVDAENCLLVDIGDISAMATAIGRILDEPPLADQCRRGGRRTSAGASWPEIASDLLTSYRVLGALRPPWPHLDPWRTDQRGLTPEVPGTAERLEARLATSTSSRLAIPVSWPAFEGHDVVSWQIVAQRDGGVDRTERVYLPYRANQPPKSLTYLSALNAFASGKGERALAQFVSEYHSTTDVRAKAAIGRWVTLALLETGREDKALEVALSGASAYPDYSDYSYLAVVIAGLRGAGGVEPLSRVVETATLLGPSSRYPEWFADTAGLVARHLP